jgi:hypothetical protein
MIPAHDLELLRAPPGRRGAVCLRAQIFATATGWRELPLDGATWRKRPPGCDHLRAWQISPRGPIIYTTEQYDERPSAELIAWIRAHSYTLRHTSFKIHNPCGGCTMFAIWQPAALDATATLQALDKLSTEYWQ